MKPIVICLLVILISLILIALYVFKNRAKRFDIKWLGLMRKVVNLVEMCHHLNSISNNEYEEYMQEIEEQIKEYEKWVSRTIG